MAGGSGECRPLEFQLTPEEIRDEGKATGLEKNLFDTALLVAGGDHAFVVYEFRDLIVRCDRGLFCHGIRWTSPLTEIQEVEVALQKRHGAHFRIPRHRAADAAALPGGGLVVLPAITHVDAQAETFRQRDMLYRFSLQGELVEKRDLGRRVLAIAGQGPDLLVLGERLMPERIALEAQATPATPKKP